MNKHSPTMKAFIKPQATSTVTSILFSRRKSPRQKQRRMGQQRKGILSDSTSPKFFRIIFDPRQHTLRIPLAFLKRCAQNLPNRVFLRVPTGSASEVELIRFNGETLLRKGWKEFKERYSIGFGHLLIFEYDGSSQFDVIIFDTTATEINYLDFEMSNRRQGEAIDVENVQQNKRTRRDNSNPEECSGRQCRDAAAKQRSAGHEKAMAFTRARTFHNPFTIAVMHPSYVSGDFPMNVSPAFARRNLTSTITDVTLLLTNGKTWTVRCILREKTAKLASGWKDFVKDNGLKVGDACVFEAVEKCVWNVIIFRTS